MEEQPRDKMVPICAESFTTKAEKKVDPFKFDVNSVVFMMYMLYKCNTLTRHHIRHMLKIIKDEAPGDIMKYLVEEAARAT